MNPVSSRRDCAPWGVTRKETSLPDNLQDAQKTENSVPTDASNALPPLPEIDIVALHNCYNQHKDDSNESPLIRNMFGLMLHLYSRQSESDILKSEMQLVNSRLDAIEAKIGGPDEISDKLGLAVQNVPYPNHGYTDLDVIRHIFAEIRAPGVNVLSDVVKAVRKLPNKQIHNQHSQVLGTVLVEMKSEASRSSVMKHKHFLQQHHDPSYSSIVIKNMRDRGQLFAENAINNVLRRIPGCENSYVTPSGQIREFNTSTRFQSYRHAAPHRNQHAPNHPSSVVYQQAYPNQQFQVLGHYVSSSGFQHPQQQIVSQGSSQHAYVHPHQVPPLPTQHPSQHYPSHPFNTSQVPAGDSSMVAAPAPPFNAHHASTVAIPTHSTAPHVTAPHAHHVMAPSHISQSQSAHNVAVSDQYQQGVSSDTQSADQQQIRADFSDSD